MSILFTDPLLEYNIIREEWIRSVDRIAQRGVFVGGSEVANFESAFATYCGAGGAVGVGNGTDALFLTLKALGIGPGDEVITAANSFIATAAAIHHTGAVPVLVDCEASNYLIDMQQVKGCVTSRTKAIIPVHLYGQMVDLTSIVDWAHSKGIAIIEDCAQSAGARLDGSAAGSSGIAGCFSFYPDKNLGALGDAGAIVSSSPELLGKLRMLRNHGGEVRAQHEFPGYNSRLDPLQASVLGLKLKRLDEWSECRRQAAAWYESYLQAHRAIELPERGEKGSHVFHLYVIRVKDGLRDKLKKHLQKKGILTAIHYPVPIHLTRAFTQLGYLPGAFPISEQYSQEILSLPMHIGLTEEMVATIASEINLFMNQGAAHAKL